MNPPIFLTTVSLPVPTDPPVADDELVEPRGRVAFAPVSALSHLRIAA